MTLNRNTKLILAVVLVLIILQMRTGSDTSVRASATQTYYVAPNGDDENSGTISQPWLTIQHAADTLVAGDTVLIRNGVYNEQVITVRGGNATGGYIVFSAYPGETPVIDGTGITTGNNGFIVEHSYIKLLRLEVRNWADNGIMVWSAGYVEISDCKIHEVGGGIGLGDGTHDFVLNRDEMYSFTLFGFDASPSGGADCYNGVINDCVSHTGRDPEQNVDGFALGHGDQHNFVLNRCEVYDVFDGFDMSARDTQLNRCASHDNWNTGYKIWEDNVTLINCLSYHNENNNLQLPWNNIAGTVTLRNCHFVDSTLEGSNIWVENSADRLRIYNCIIASGDNIGLEFPTLGADTYQGDYNIFHSDNPDRAIVVRDHEPEFSLSMIAAGDWTKYSGQDQHSLVCTDPASQLFKDLASGDIHLRLGSIAIDAGTTSNAPQVDYDGLSRPQGGGYDIGAYEFAVLPSYTVEYGGVTYHVLISSDSSIANFLFDQPAGKISFNVTGTSATNGYCNVTIPNVLLGGTCKVLVGGSTVTPVETSNATHTFLYFTYANGIHKVEIISTVIPEFPSVIVSLALFATIALVVIFTKRLTVKTARAKR